MHSLVYTVNLHLKCITTIWKFTYLLVIVRIDFSHSQRNIFILIDIFQAFINYKGRYRLLVKLISSLLALHTIIIYNLPIKN